MVKESFIKFPEFRSFSHQDPTWVSACGGLTFFWKNCNLAKLFVFKREGRIKNNGQKCVWERENVCVCMCVWEREGESECVWERERDVECVGEQKSNKLFCSLFRETAFSFLSLHFRFFDSFFTLPQLAQNYEKLKPHFFCCSQILFSFFAN